MERQEIGNAVLYRADCAELLPEITAAGGIDALITDPPYAMQAAGGGIGARRAYMSAIKGHLDGGFDFGLLSGFANWMCFCSKSSIVPLIGQAERQGLNWQILTWNKRNPTPLTCGNYLPDTEYMIHAYRRHIWESKTRFVVGNVEKNPFAHPTVKPQYVMEKVVLSASKAGDTVLDPFMGTGSTGIACLKHGRRFIGIEREAEYFDIACARLEAAASQGRLF